MAKWHLKHGSWWMVQWSWAGWLSLGIHIDPRIHRSEENNFGPYVDFHIGPAIVSLGRCPHYTHPDTYFSYGSRGGINPLES